MAEPGGSDKKPRTRLPHLALTRSERRAFMLEMASVIAGILIALAVNETVQDWHWARDVAEARAGIQEEIRFDNDWLAYRVMLRPCRSAALDRARTDVESLAMGTAAGPSELFDTLSGGRLDDQNWQALRTSPTFEHFPDAERRRLGEYYSQLADIRAWVGQESQAWSELSLITYAPRTIQRSDISSMRIAIRTANLFGELIGRNAANQLKRAVELVPAPLLAKSARYGGLVKRASGACARLGLKPRDIDAAMRDAET